MYMYIVEMAVRSFYGLKQSDPTEEEGEESSININPAPEDSMSTSSKQLTTSRSPSLTTISSAVEDTIRKRNVQERKKRLFEPERVYKEFPRQKKAIDFARNCYQSVAVFAFESEEFGKEGQRRYIATTYYEFGKLYLKKKIKHYYEVIVEGAACNLYFDIEFKREVNPTVDAILVLEIFIEYVCYQLHVMHHVTCDRSNILDLDSSTPQKFSRHLIFHMPSAVFRNNILVGHFVRGICDQVRQLKHLTESGVERGKACQQVFSCSKENSINPLCPSGERLLQLFVNNEQGGNVLICDEAVYTRNRNFRLYLSSKLGKTATLTVAQESKFKSSYSESSTRRRWSKRYNTLMDSLVCNVSFETTKHMRILSSGSKQTTLSRQLSPSLQTTHSEAEEITSFAGTDSDAKMGFNHSPFPLVDSFITSTLTKGGIQGTIRRWTYFPNGKMIMYDIQHNRWCENIARTHKSNNVMIIADLKRGTYYQKCHDPECRRINFRSNEISIPLECNPVSLQQEKEQRNTPGNVLESEAMFYDDLDISLEDIEQFDEAISNEHLELGEDDKSKAFRKAKEGGNDWDVSLEEIENFDDTSSDLCKNLEQNGMHYHVSKTDSTANHIQEDIEQCDDTVLTEDLHSEERNDLTLGQEVSNEAEFYVGDISLKDIEKFEETSSPRVRKRKRSLTEAEDSLDAILRDALEDYESHLSPIVDN